MMETMTQKSIKKNNLQASDIAEITDIKRRFEMELDRGEVIRKDLTEKLFKLIRENRDATNRIGTKKEYLAKLKLRYIEMEQKINSFDESVCKVKDMVGNSKLKVAEDIEMGVFQQESMDLVNTYFEAMQFYSEDRLMLEWSKKKEGLRARRVAVTEVDAAIDEKKQDIQRKKAEIEKEIERKKQEEAAKQARINEENAKRHMAKQFNFALNDSSTIGSGRPFARPVTPRCENYKNFLTASYPKVPQQITEPVKKDLEEGSSLSQSLWAYKNLM